MKYKILPGTRLYEQLRTLQKKLTKANRHARSISKKLGAKGIAVTSRHLAGDIGGLKFDEKPVGYKQVGQTWQHLYMPLVSNKAAWKTLAGLTIIENDELNKILNFKSSLVIENDSWGSYDRPAVHWRKRVIIVVVHEKIKYKPVRGMREITVSEYNKLLKQK